MAWHSEQPQGQECRKSRPRVIRYCTGIGLDIGADTEKLCSNALGVGLGQLCGIKVDTSAPRHLGIFADGVMDFVFSAFELQRSMDEKAVETRLREWWRVLKPGGHLILYVPHKDLYPQVGKPGADPRNKIDLDAPMVLAAMERIGHYTIVSNDLRDQLDEYAFEIVLKKRISVEAAMLPVKLPPKRQTKAAVIRYGGYGDCIMALAVTRELKRLGHHVTFLTAERGTEIFRYEDSVDEVVSQFGDQVEPSHLMEYLERLSTHYDRFVNLCESAEKALLFRGSGGKDGQAEAVMDKEYSLPYEERHRIANKNYMEFMLARAGMPNVSPLPPMIQLTEEEKRIGAFYRRRFPEDFLVVMTMGGSADHKMWVNAEAYVKALLERIPESRVVLVGEKQLQLLEWRHDRVERRCGIMPFRSSCIAASVADLVVTTETGMAHAAAGFGVPLIVMLSHSSEENLTKHWPSAMAIRPPVPCHPCHQLHYKPDDCVTDPVDFAFAKGDPRAVPICATRMSIASVMEKTLQVYEARSKRPIENMNGNGLKRLAEVPAFP